MADREGRERGQMEGEGRALDRIVVKAARRVAVTLAVSIAVALLLLTLYSSSTSVLLLRAITIGLAATAVFSLFEVWPRRLPRGIERWILQVVAVGVAMPLTVFVMHRLAAPEGARPFFQDHDWMLIWISAVLVALPAGNDDTRPPRGRRKELGYGNGSPPAARPEVAPASRPP